MAPSSAACCSGPGHFRPAAYQIPPRPSRSFQVTNVFANMSVWEKPALRGAVGHRPSLLILEKYDNLPEVRDRTAQIPGRYQPDGTAPTCPRAC